MTRNIRNTTFHILKNVLSLPPIGWFLLSLFPIGRNLHFSFQIRIAENTPTSRFTICSLQSRRGQVQEDKRMAYIYTHGLFIT